MEDIENELDSVLNRYQEKQERTRESESREQDEDRALEDEFRNLFSNIVEPSMTHGKVPRIKRCRF
jgi:hypothetical protein